MSGNRLTEPEVKQRLEECGDEKCVDELYSFGQMMVNESLDTLHRLDAKAYAVAGYSGATFTALVSVAAFAKNMGPGLVWPIALILALLFALAAAAFSLAAIRFRPVDWFSPNEWIKEDCLDDPAFLRRYHILCMYGVQQSQRNRTFEKIRKVKFAVESLVLSGFMLCVSVAVPFFF
jgi:hypothetical protein